MIAIPYYVLSAVALGIGKLVERPVLAARSIRSSKPGGCGSDHALDPCGAEL